MRRRSDKRAPPLANGQRRGFLHGCYWMPSRFSSSRILASSSTVALGMGKVPTLVAAMPRSLTGLLDDGQEGAADGVQVHQSVDDLLALGDAGQVVLPEGPDPGGADLRHHVAEGTDAAVAAGEHVVGEVVVKAGVDLKAGESGT